MDNIYKRQAIEALQILSKMDNLSFIYAPLSDYIHYLERDLNEAQDKLSRRNMQIDALKRVIEHNKKYECFPCAEKNMQIKDLKDRLNEVETSGRQISTRQYYLLKSDLVKLEDGEEILIIDEKGFQVKLQMDQE